MKFFGINPIKLEGSKFGISLGYSKHVSLTLEGKNYFPILVAQIVNWNIKDLLQLEERNLSIKIMDKNNALNFSILTKKTPHLARIPVCGCGIIKLGNSPWGPYTNFEIGKVKNWRSILVDVAWDFKASGVADLVFDSWITKNKTGLPKITDMELMVWLDYKNLYPFGEKKEESEKFSVHYSPLKKVKKFLPIQKCGTVSYFYTKSSLKKISFDLIKLILNSAKYFKIKNIKNYWIRTIDFGVEYARNTKVEAKIYKLKYKFSSAP